MLPGMCSWRLTTRTSGSRFARRWAKWRAETKTELNYKDELYRRKEFGWSASNYSCCFLMMCDERFCDWRAGRYLVDAFLEEGEREFGGMTVSCFGRPIRVSVPTSAISSTFTVTCRGAQRFASRRAAIPEPGRQGLYRLQSLGRGHAPGEGIRPRSTGRVGGGSGSGWHLPGHDEQGRSGIPCQAGRRAARRDPGKRRGGAAGKTCTIIMPPGRNGLATAMSRVCCGTNGWSGGTCSTRSGAGITITPANSMPRG